MAPNQYSVTNHIRNNKPTTNDLNEIVLNVSKKTLFRQQRLNERGKPYTKQYPNYCSEHYVGGKTMATPHANLFAPIH